MSDVLHRTPPLTPTQQASLAHRARFRAGIESHAPKPAPAVVPLRPDPELADLRGALRSAQTEIDDLRKKAIDITGDVAELKRLIAGNDRIKKIQLLVAEHYGVTRSNLLSAYRGEQYVRPRHVAMYLAKSVTGLSFPVIAKHFGGRDHTTVLHAVRKIERARLTDKALDAALHCLAARLEVAP
jgi:chromosomal replication initiator protein